MPQTILMTLAALDAELDLKETNKANIIEYVKQEQQGVDLQNDFGQTALMIAITNQQYELAFFIVNKLDADIKLKDQYGETAVDYFNKISDKTDLKIEELGLALFKKQNLDFEYKFEEPTNNMPGSRKGVVLSSYENRLKKEFENKMAGEPGSRNGENLMKKN